MKKFITMVLSLIILSILFLATSCSGSRDDTQDVIGGKIVMYAAPATMFIRNKKYSKKQVSKCGVSSGFVQ